MNLQSASVFSSKPARARVRLFMLGTAFALVSGSAFAQDTGEIAYEAYVEGLKKLGVEVENGNVAYDEGSDTLTLTDSTITMSGVLEDIPAEKKDVTDSDGATDIEPAELTELNYSLSLNSGTVTITGLSHEDGDFTAASWVYSDDSEMALSAGAEGKGQVKIDGRLTGMSATNYSFTMPELPAEDEAHQVSRWLPFVKATLLTSYDELKLDNTAMTIEVRETEDNKDTLFLSGTVQIAGYRMVDAEDGRIGEYSIDSMTQSLQTLDPASGKMLDQTTSQGKTIYKDMDTAVFFDLFDPDVPETGDEVVMLGSASAIDYKSKQDLGDGLAVDVSVDKTSMDELTVVKRDNNILSLLDGLFTKQTPAPEELITGVFQFYRSFGVTDARLNGIKVSVPTPGPEKPIDVSIKEMAMSEINSDGIGEMMMVGLDAPDLPEGASVKIDWAAIGDIEFAEYTPMRAMISTLMADPAFGQDHPIDVARAFLPRSFGYEIEGLDVTVPDLGRTEIGKAEMTLSTTVPPIPTSFHTKTEGLKVPVAAVDDPDVQALLESLGLETVVWSDETRLYWDEATLELRLERLMVDVEGVGRAELSARLANVPKSVFEDPENQGQMALVVAQFVDASFTFKDAGLTKKGIAHIAEAQNIPEDAFREALVAETTQMTAPIQNAAFTQMISEAATKFLNNPGELKITLTPQNPVPIAQILGSLAAPQTLPDLLAVKVVAN